MGNYRLVILGSGGVGKTNLVNRLIHGNFCEEYKPTVEDIHRPIIKFPDGETHSVEILDTAGLHQFPAMRQLSIESGGAFVVVYSVVDAETFVTALAIAASVKEMKGDDTQVIVVGNKCDLSDERQVESHLALEKVISKNCLFMETSAKLKWNVHSAFFSIVRETFCREATERRYKLKLRFNLIKRVLRPLIFGMKTK